MKIVEQFNGLNGTVIPREKLVELAERAERNEQYRMASKIRSAIEGQDAQEFEISLSGREFEQLPQDLLDNLDFEETPDEEFVGLAKAVSSDDIYTRITEKMLELIAQATGAGFKKKWGDVEDSEFQEPGYLIPFNFVSKKQYRGINSALLTDFGSKNLVNPFFLTFNQIDKLGGKLRKGSKGEMVVYFTKLYSYQQEDPKIDFGTYDKKRFEDWFKKNVGRINNYNIGQINTFVQSHTIPILKYYNIFNGDNIDGIDFDLKNFMVGYHPGSGTDDQEGQRIEIAESIILNYPKPQPKLSHKGNSANYNRNKDRVTMPIFKSFETPIDYYRTLLHEYTHSTGIASRMDRVFGKRFGDKDYAFEELVAEFGAVFLSAHAGIIWRNNSNHAEYLKNWSMALEHLKKDNRFLMRAASKAQAAADFVLNLDKNGEPAYLQEILKKSEKTEAKKPVPGTKKTKPKPYRFNVGDSVYSPVKKMEGIIKKQKRPLKNSALANENAVYDLVWDNGKKAVNQPESKLDPSILVKPEPRAKKKPTVKPKKTGKKKKGEPLGADTLFPGLTGPNSEIKMSTEQFKRFSVPELRNFLVLYYNAVLKGEKKAIENSLKNVELVTKAGRKIARGGAMYSAKYAVIEHFESVIKNSKYNNWGDKKKKDGPDVLGYMNFKSKVTVDGEKRHVRISVVVYKDRKTLLYNYEVGENKKPPLTRESPKLSSCTKKTLNKDNKKRPKNPKNGKNGLKNPNAPSPDAPHGTPEEPETAETAKKPQTGKMPEGFTMASDGLEQKAETFRLKGEMGKLLGDLQRFRLAILLQGDPHAGKSEMCGQLANAFLDHGFSGAYFDLEQGGLSSKDTQASFDRNITKENLAKLAVTGEAENGVESVRAVADKFDFIVVDSFQELDAPVTAFNDLRKDFPNTIWIVIFQQNAQGGVRGGIKSAYDTPVRLKVYLVDNTFVNNYAEVEKNRGNPIGIKYNVSEKRVIEEPGQEPAQDPEAPREEKPTGRLIIYS